MRRREQDIEEQNVEEFFVEEFLHEPVLKSDTHTHTRTHAHVHTHLLMLVRASHCNCSSLDDPLISYSAHSVKHWANRAISFYDLIFMLPPPAPML